MKTDTKWERSKLNTKFFYLIFVKYLKESVRREAPLWRNFPKFLKAVSKQYITAKQQNKVFNLEPLIFLEVKSLIFRHFSKIWKCNNLCDVMKTKLVQEGPKFVYYNPTVIKRSNSITAVFYRLVIHFWDQFFKIVILWPFLIPRSDVILKLVQKRPKF